MGALKPWGIYETLREVHVVPEDDLLAHELSETCACQPKIIPILREDGSTGWVVVHAAWDGRRDP